MAALSFSYAPPISSQCTPYITQDENSSIVSTLKETCQNIMTTRGCQISVITTKTKLSTNATATTTSSTNTTTESNNNNDTEFNLSLTGSTQAIMEARGDLLQHCPLEIKLSIQIPPTLKLQLLTKRFNQLQQELNTKINVIPEKPHHSSLVSDNKVIIEIMGNLTQVEICRVRVLVAIDEIMDVNHVDDDDELHQEIDKDLQSVIYITGEPNQVSRVKDMLNKLAVQKAKSMYHKDTALYARKIDWLLLHRRDELRKIMHDNGAYIEFPPIGSGDNRVTVYAENRVNAERTLRALNFQACNIYEACFYFNRDNAIYDTNVTSTTSANGSAAHAFFDSLSNLSALVSQLSQISGSEVVYKTDPGCIEVLGAERAIRNVYQRLQEIQFLQAFHHYTLFRVESSNEQRDFISGKKNGKINKIMKTSGAKIRFMPFMNDYNFVIEVESTSFTKALDGLTLLQEELPAEISFYVPESYHKRIIGVGGKNIQRIMKKYGVYVKFSNTEEFASLGGYYNNQDNVVARTPMKNQINLDNLRHAVMELIHPKDRDYVSETVQIPFGAHRDLIHDYQDVFIADELLKKTNTQVVWPDAELASDDVELLGPEAHMAAAFKMMESIVPESYDLHVPPSSAFNDAVLLQSSELFHERVVEAIRKTFGIQVVAVNQEQQNANDGPCFIRLNMTRDKMMTSLKEVLKIIIDYLNEQQVPLYDDTTADALFAIVEKKQLLAAHRKKHNNSTSHVLNVAAAAVTATTSSSSSSSNNSHHILNNNNNNPLFDTSSTILKYHPHHPGAIQHGGNSSLLNNNMTTTSSSTSASSVSMVRSSDDTIYTSPPPPAPVPLSSLNNNPIVSPPAYQFFSFPNDTLPHNPLDNPHWMPLNAQQPQQQPIPSTSTSNGSSSNSNNNTTNDLRAIFDAPLDLTDQERAVLSNYRYGRMAAAGSNFGFPQAMPSAPSSSSTADIWSTSHHPMSTSARRSGSASSSGATPNTSGFPTSITSPPTTNRRKPTANYGSSPTSADIRRFNESTGNGVFYASMGHHDFNPYHDAPNSLKSSQSMPEPMLESHFRPSTAFQHHQPTNTNTATTTNNNPTTTSFHNLNQAARGFGQFNLGGVGISTTGGPYYRQPVNDNNTTTNTNTTTTATNTASFIPRNNAPPKHDQFFTNL
ncbi:MAG: hypothetical protein EXX96DRAFT_540246 [Benjaminiella poitrasii]|nr:MAG: hypothetical protein EXX96DRAFT_540246 [Benjaminiella poitrasii]